MTAGSTPASLPAHIQLAGLGLILREWTADDLPVMVELFDDPQVDNWTPLRSPFNLTSAHVYLDKARQDRAAGSRLQLAITTDGNHPKGEVLLTRTGDHGSDAELAYAIGPLHRRQRLATRAVQLITSYAYDVLAMNQVLLRIAEHNHASAAVAQSAGFELTSTDPITRDGSLYPLHTWRHRKPHRTPASAVAGQPPSG
jgi:RimJ/RimL family protein N-acetyltransferase